MDEKKVRETIAWLETKREIHKRGAYKSPIIPKEQIDMIEGYYNLTIEALEKQLPKKPNFEGDGYAPNGTFVYDTWICPSCEGYYEVDYDDYVYCPQCGQKLDWPE